MIIYFLFKNGLRWEFPFTQDMLEELKTAWPKKDIFHMSSGSVDLAEVVAIGIERKRAQ